MIMDRARAILRVVRSRRRRTLSRLFIVNDRDDDEMGGRDAGRQDEAVVIAMGHDEAADQARRHSPRGRPSKFSLAA